jgi:biopolymer transport protein ExbB/TolQ
MTILDFFNNGGPVMWPLLACSVIVLTVIIERALFWLGVRRQRNHSLMDEILAIAEEGDVKIMSSGSLPLELCIGNMTWSKPWKLKVR